MKKRLIVGLGNIGDKYYNTRHNIGFRALDHLVKVKEISYEPVNFGLLAKTSYKGRETLLLKPDTYMNLSGNAVLFWIKKEKIELEHVLIVVDDLYLPFGTLRLRTKGASAGHNGLKSIEERLLTNQYSRLKFGVGNEQFNKDKQIDFVLGNWDIEEEKRLEERMQITTEIILSFIFAGPINTMNMYNGK